MTQLEQQQQISK